MNRSALRCTEQEAIERLIAAVEKHVKEWVTYSPYMTRGRIRRYRQNHLRAPLLALKMARRTASKSSSTYSVEEK